MAPKIAIVFYSLYGHTVTLVETAAKAARADGAEATVYQIPETLSAEVLAKLHAAPRRTDIPTLTPDDLLKYDGYIFVIPTRYGRSVAQFSAFFDMTGGQWAKQALAGKFATVMTSTGTQGGGMETTAFTTLPFFVHHGIIHVPMGYGFGKTTNMTEIKGGAPWGAGTHAGADGSRQPSALELEETTYHAQHFVSVLAQFQRGGERLKSGAATTSTAAPVKTTATTAPAAKPAAAATPAPAVSEKKPAAAPPKKKTSIWKKIKRALA